MLPLDIEESAKDRLAGYCSDILHKNKADIVSFIKAYIVVELRQEALNWQEQRKQELIEQNPLEQFDRELPTQEEIDAAPGILKELEKGERDRAQHEAEELLDQLCRNLWNS